MTDRISKEHRSWNMSRIRFKDTEPEKTVRSLLHHMGYRFRLHVKDLPGSPDIVLPKYRTVILVHGCFWHRHPKCKFAYQPKSRIEFWSKKFKANIKRDIDTIDKLRSLGWKVEIVWECQLKELDSIEQRIKKLLTA